MARTSRRANWNFLFTVNPLGCGGQGADEPLGHGAEGEALEKMALAPAGEAGWKARKSPCMLLGLRLRRRLEAQNGVPEAGSNGILELSSGVAIS